MITAAMVRAAAKARVSDSNLNSVMIALERYGARVGLDKPHREAQFWPQLMHESGDFRFDRELWGPTPAQKRYDTRTDLGNTPAVDGDGFKNRGRGPMQVTGGANIAEFYEWCVELDIGPVPDFRRNPDLINTDPWEGLSALWYWSTRNLNKWADQGDVETITKKINGGKNGFADRVDRLGRVSLVMLGYGPEEVRRFQSEHGLDADGDVGPKTRAAMHRALVALSPGEAMRREVTIAPVTETLPVVPAAVEKEVRQKTNWFTSIFSGTGLLGAFGAWAAGVDPVKLLIIVAVVIASGFGFLLLGEWIIRRIKTIQRAIVE